MKSLSMMIQSLFICVLLFSCTPVPIIIPLFPDEPLEAAELQFLKPGETTLAEIKEHLWEPLAIRKNGKLLLYRESNSSWVGWVGTGFMELKNEDFLLIEIDENNKLKRYEIIKRKEGFFIDEIKDCTSWGLCLDMEMLQFQSLESIVEDTTYIIFSPKIEQSELEHPPEGQCQIITYLDNKSGFGTLRVHIDENPQRAISKKGFLRNIVLPGNHSITANWPLGFDKTDERYKESLQQNVSCNSGESLFVNISGKGAGFWFRPPKLNIKIDATEDGLQVIKERRLIID
jgi:hypothetical protein